MNNIKQGLLLYLKGLGMGCADVIPGVSGGTIAFITGIYTTLLDSLKNINLTTLKLLFRGSFKDFWQAINGSFLLTLFAGILTSLISLSKIVIWLLNEYPIQVWSFFFGLIIISSIYVLKEVTKWNMATIFSLLIGIAVAYYITVATPAETPDSYWFIYLIGCIAICAMILPGISGSFILLLFSKYEYILSALNQGDFITIGIFALGCITGLMTFARVVSWVLHNYHNLAIALLSGFMLGALNKVWPWKEVISYREKANGTKVPFIEESILPSSYEQIAGQPSELFSAVLFCIIGIGIVLLLEKIAGSKN